MRRAAADDLPAILKIHALHHNILSDRAPTSTEVAAWARMMATDDLTVYLAEIASRPVGTATTMVMANITYDCHPTFFVEAVVVVPDLRRRGVATAVMRQALDDAKAAGCHKVQLLSHKRHANDGAHRLYKNLGFEAEAEGFRLYLHDRP